MAADYAGAQWLPCKNFWPGGNSKKFVVIHGTASCGPQTGYQLATGSEFNDGNTASVHYINDVDGTVYQVVSENDYNHDTISIENVKHSCDNSEALSTPQYQSLVKLARDICKRNNIPMRKATGADGGIIGHFDLDPQNRARCPGTFDWNGFIRDVQAGTAIPVEQAAVYALEAGFTGDAVQTILAIAITESGFRPLANNIDSDGSIDRGILQLNSHWHIEVSDAAAYDPAQAFKEAYRISSNESNFNSWNTYKSGAYKAHLGEVMPVLSSTGEVADFCDADQFQPAKTQDACGFFAVALVDAAAPVGKPCTKTVAQVISEAETWYAQYDGDNSISNNLGMSLPQLYQLLKQVGLQYYPLRLDVNQIRDWVKAGFPVIIMGAEAGMHDMGLGDVVPYYWNFQSFNHTITITGVTSDGNFLVRDSANVTNLNDPNSLRPGPRKYDASKLQLISTTAVVMHGQQMPTVQGGVPVGVPAGWLDTKDAQGNPILKNPVNSFVVRAGFRNFVLNYPGGWESWNVPLEDEHAASPLEESNPALGGGTVQLFRNRRLEWQQSSNRIFEGWSGQELAWYVSKLASETALETTDEATISSLNTQVATLQQQLQQVSSGSISPDEQAAINAAVAALAALQKYSQ